MGRLTTTLTSAAAAGLTALAVTVTAPASGGNTPPDKGAGTAADVADWLEAVRAADPDVCVEFVSEGPAGVPWNFAPCVCVTREDRWGRV